MRWLTLTIIAAGLAWSGYWFIGKSAREAGLNNWFEKRVDKGWIATGDIKLRGFPNRYDAIITDVVLANPEKDWAWSAERFDLLQLSYKPNHIIAMFPQTQMLSSPNEKITINSADMRASLSVTDPDTLTLLRATVSVIDLELNSTAGWDNRAKDALIALRKTDTGPHTYDVAITANEFNPASINLGGIDRGGIMPDAFTTFKMDAVLHYNEALSKRSFEDGTSLMQRMEIKGINLEWGDLILRAAGDVKLDDMGYPTGKVTVRAVNWQSMIDIAVANNSIDAKTGKHLKDGLGLLAALTGKKDTIDVPLRFKNRKTRLGPINIGPAPQIKFP